MAKDFKDIVQRNLPKIKSDPGLAADFVKNALITGWTNEDISRGLLLNGIKDEDIVVYLKNGHEKFDKILDNLH